MNNYTIYMHVSPSNKRYIGITSQTPKQRWLNGNSYKTQQYFWRAIEKYGWDNFKHIIIAKGLIENEAKWLEIELIKIWDTTNPNKGYNISLGGEGANFYNIKSKGHISSCCRGKRKHCGKLQDGTKLKWKYLIWKHNKKYRIKEMI